MKYKLSIFFIIGLTLYLIDIGLNSYDEKEIYISDQEIISLVTAWKSQVGRNPNDDEIARIINNLVEEEILYREALKLGLDREDDSIAGTADRVAKMYVSELCSGLSYNRFPKVSVFENKMGYDQMIIQKDITFHSLCEHHLVNFNGMAQVAYIPNDNVVGLSKLNRIVNFFARRPQVQERMTVQIFNELTDVLQTKSVALLIDADHLCVASRGIKDVTSSTITFEKGGDFENHETWTEFLSLINVKLK